ncbi:hypothetical protein D9M70_477100 [compost metagenome]
MVALHGREDAVGSRLHRQVDEFHQFRNLGVGLDQRVGELQRVRGGVADAVDAIDGGDHADQLGEVGDAAVMGQAAVAVDVLPQQGHLAHAVLGQVDDLGQHVVEGAADFLATGIGHHAEGAVLAAAFHHRNEGAGAVDARFGQAVELLDLGEADVHLGFAGDAGGVDHFRQAVQGLRAEHHVDVGRALADGGAFLAGHAAADADHQFRVLLLQLAPAAKLRKHLFLRLLADRAGIEQDHVGFFRMRGDFQRLMLAEQVDHARAVVLVHLAAVGFDIELLGHAL